MEWRFANSDLKENVHAQDQNFTPDEIAILFVMYDHDRDQRKFLSAGQREVIERLISEGRTPSRRQYQLAKRMAGIMQEMDHDQIH